MPRSAAGIIFRTVLPLVRPSSLDAASETFGAPLAYPDGSLQFDTAGGDDFVRLQATLGIDALQRRQLTRAGVMSNLLPLPPKDYAIWYLTHYQQIIGEGAFGGGGDGPYLPPCEHPMDKLPVTVWLHHKPNADVRAEFVRRVSRWLGALRTTGLFGEGPVSAASDAVTFRGRRVDFRIDAGHTGPHTLVWLVLMLLGFGHEVAPVESVLYDSENETVLKLNIEANRATAQAAGRTWGDAETRAWLERRRGAGNPMIVPLVVGSGV